MQINGTPNLPVMSSLQTGVVSPRPGRQRPPVTTTPAQTPPDRVDNREGDPPSRRPPLFAQPMTNARFSRTGEQALRAYQDVAMAGGREELVNRINEMA